MGPLHILHPGGRRRATFKAWVAVITCRTTKALSLVLLGGYDTDSLLVGLSSHAAVYGSPELILTDRGSQLQAAADGSPNWDTVQHQTAPRGTAWKFVPPGTPWRNGLSERMVQMVKRSLLRELSGGRLLDTLQAQSLLHRIAEIINSRPLTARSFAVDDFAAICPRDLLLGSSPADRLSHRAVGGVLEGDLEDLPQRVREVEMRVDAWWKRFSQDVFPLLVPRSTWRQEQPELLPGSLVLVRYEAKFGKDRFRMGRVVDTRRDADGLVRTAWVGMRALRRAVREPADVCRAGLQMVELPVQRLILILPPDEQPAELLEGLALFPPMPGTRGQPAQAARPMVQQQDPEEQIVDLPATGVLGGEQPAQAIRPVVPQPGVQVQQPDPEEEIVDLPRPPQGSQGKG